MIEVKKKAPGWEVTLVRDNVQLSDPEPFKFVADALFFAEGLRHVHKDDVVVIMSETHQVKIEQGEYYARDGW